MSYCVSKLSRLLSSVSVGDFVSYTDGYKSGFFISVANNAFVEYGAESFYEV